MATRANELQEIQEISEHLLTDEVCKKHESVNNLRKQCDQLEPRWEQMKTKLDSSLEQLENRVRIIYCIAGKFGRDLVKIHQISSLCIMYVWRFCTEPPNLSPTNVFVW